MGYIGNQASTNFSSLAKQVITGNGGATYTLTTPVANANELEIFVNNVRQEPAVAYTVSGTTLTMTGNVESTDDFYVVYQGKAVQTVVPPDGSVTSEKLATNIAFAGNATFADNGKAIFGAGNDLQVYHDGSHSYVSDAGTGNLQLSTNGTAIKMLRGNGEVLSSFNIGGSVDLYHSNAKKFETTASGINVNGSVTATGGFVGAGNTPNFGARRSNAQTTNINTWTKVQFNQEIVDSDGKFDMPADKFTPTVAGTYIIHGQLANNNLYNQASLEVAIYKNGSILAMSEVVANNSTSNRNYTVNVTAIDVADTDDYYELYGRQQLGNGVAITEGSRNIFLGYKI